MKNTLIKMLLLVTLLITFMFSIKCVKDNKKTIWDKINDATIVKIELVETQESICITNSVFNVFINKYDLYQTNIEVGDCIYRLIYNPEGYSSNKEQIIMEIGEKSCSINGVLYTCDYYSEFLRSAYFLAKSCNLVD